MIGKRTTTKAPFVRQPQKLPLPPVFLCDESGDWIELEETVETERSLYDLGASEKCEFIAYSANQTKWRMQYETPRLPRWPWVIRRLRRSSVIVVPVEWQECGSYSFEELRSMFVKRVTEDDVLTQFVKPEELAARMAVATSFEALVDVWKWLLFPPA